MIVIHVGLKKAGSSSIQSFMADNEHTLRQLGVDYAQIGRKTAAHHNFAREIIEGLGNFDPAYGTISELSDYWHQASGTTLVLSSEAFEEAEIIQIVGMRDMLLRARGNEEFRIVVVLRDLLDLMPSSYAQRVKYGATKRDFDFFFEARMRERRVNYFDTAKRWAEIFGWDSMHLRLLDRNHLVNGDLLDDFLDLCKLEPQVMANSLVRRPNASNTSPGWKVLEGIRALFCGHHGLPPEHFLSAKFKEKDKRRVGNAAMLAGDKRGWNEDRGLYLTVEQAQRCVEIFGANIVALNAWLPSPVPVPGDLAARGFKSREFLPDARHIPAVELRAFYENTASQMTRRQTGGRSQRVV